VCVCVNSAQYRYAIDFAKNTTTEPSERKRKLRPSWRGWFLALSEYELSGKYVCNVCICLNERNDIISMGTCTHMWSNVTREQTKHENHGQGETIFKSECCLARAFKIFLGSAQISDPSSVFFFVPFGCGKFVFSCTAYFFVVFLEPSIRCNC
jgi:hypothetical protein